MTHVLSPRRRRRAGEEVGEQAVGKVGSACAERAVGRKGGSNFRAKRPRRFVRGDKGPGRNRSGTLPLPLGSLSPRLPVNLALEASPTRRRVQPKRDGPRAEAMDETRRRREGVCSPNEMSSSRSDGRGRVADAKTCATRTRRLRAEAEARASPTSRRSDVWADRYERIVTGTPRCSASRTTVERPSTRDA